MIRRPYLVWFAGYFTRRDRTQVWVDFGEKILRMVACNLTWTIPS
jgi:hypothetical protein